MSSAGVAGRREGRGRAETGTASCRGPHPHAATCKVGPPGRLGPPLPLPAVRLPEVALEARVDLGIVELAAEADDRQQMTLREAAHVDPGRSVDEDPDRARAALDEHLVA